MAERLLSLSPGCQLAAVTLYLEDSVGLNEYNLAVLAELHRWLAHLEMPFIIGGDWNVEAQDLIDSGWPSLVGASVAAPLEPTCNGKTYDFFVVSRELEPLVQSVVSRLDTPNGPHCLVLMQLDARWAKPMVEVLRAPKKFKLDFELDDGAKKRRDDFMATVVWHEFGPQDHEGAIGQWFDMAEEALIQAPRPAAGRGAAPPWPVARAEALEGSSRSSEGGQPQRSSL